MRCVFALPLLLLALAVPPRTGAWAQAPAEEPAGRRNAVGVELIVLGVHFREDTLRLGERYPRRLDDEGRWVLLPGVEVNHDFALAEPLWGAEHVRLGAAGYRDSMDRPAGYVAVTLRWQTVVRPRLEAALDVGVGLSFRKDWNGIPGYVDDGFWRRSRGWQYRWLPAGEVDLLYALRPGLQAVWSIVPGVPFIMVHAVGLRWRY